MSEQAPEAATARVAEEALPGRHGRAWLAAMAVAAAFVAMLAASLAISWIEGLGTWGLGSHFHWGFDLINYAWWIGVANGASLFAAILVLRRHELHTSVNRFAEATALMAVLCAALFPIIHLGRPWLFYWVFPYPATTGLWPQFRSTLTWDLWAIATHAIVTSLLWYVGLMPDLATLRDRAHSIRQARLYGILALGWRFSLRHWVWHQSAYRIAATLVLPVILVMQSIVAFEFATTLMPGWHGTKLPLLFVATGLAQGLATVLLVAALLRRSLRLEGIIDNADMDLLGRLVLGAALATAFLTLEDLVATAFVDPLPREAHLARLLGPEWPFATAFLLLGIILPQLLWSARLRTGFWVPAVVGLGVNAAVWADRYGLVVGGLRRLPLPSRSGAYVPSAVEFGLLFGTLGLFAMLLLLFGRFVPVIALFEARHAEHEARQ